MDIAFTLSEKFKGQEWSIGETYETLDWFESNTLPKPTVAELEPLYLEAKADCNAKVLKDKKIALKMRIDAGTAIGEDMSDEQAELDGL